MLVKCNCSGLCNGDDYDYPCAHYHEHDDEDDCCEAFCPNYGGVVKCVPVDGEDDDAGQV